MSKDRKGNKPLRRRIDMEEQKKTAITLQDLNFSEFQEQAIKELKSGKPLSSKNGVLTSSCQ